MGCPQAHAGLTVLRKNAKKKNSYLEGYQYGMGLGLKTHSCRALLDGLHGILNLMDPPLGTPYRHIVVILVTELKISTRNQIV